MAVGKKDQYAFFLIHATQPKDVGVLFKWPRTIRTCCNDVIAIKNRQGFGVHFRNKSSSIVNEKVLIDGMILHNLRNMLTNETD